MSTQQQQQQKPANPNPSIADIEAGDGTKQPVDISNVPGGNNPPGQQQPAAQQQPPVDPATQPPGNPDDVKDDPPADPPADDPPADDPPADDAAYWEHVQKLRGDDFKFEFPDGIDPLSPEATHHVIRSAEQRAVELFEQELAAEDPRGYAYLLHRRNGGSDEDFLATKTEVLPEYETLKDSVDLQSSFYKRVLSSRGISPEHADMIVKDAVEKKTLFGLVDKEYKQIQASQQKELEELQRESDRIARATQANVEKLGNTLKSHIIENKGLNITIPDGKRAEFLGFVNRTILYDKKDQKFYINQEVDPQALPRMLESLYYQFIGGNLKDMIVKEAKQQNVASMRLRMSKDKHQVNNSNPELHKPEKPGVGLPLSEL